MTLQQKLAQVINEHSPEKGSDTTDFILAEYLLVFLENFNKTITSREVHYGMAAQPACSHKQELINETNTIQEEIRCDVIKLIDAK